MTLACGGEQKAGRAGAHSGRMNTTPTPYAHGLPDRGASQPPGFAPTTSAWSAIDRLTRLLRVPGQTSKPAAPDAGWSETTMASPSL